MRTLLKEDFQKEFLIYKRQDSSKSTIACIAMVEGTDKNPFPVFLKETDAKRAEIYDKLTGLWNPYIADTYEILEVTDSDKPNVPRYFAVTEYVTATGSPNNESISLAEYIKRNGAVSEKTALVLCIQLCTGLKEFHKKGFVHRDLKPDNLMISHYDSDNIQIKIVDFGGAKWNNPDKHADTTVVGTLGYQAPESLAVPATEQSDIYSIGCILNYLLTGQEPGLIPYKGNHYIENIIEIATSNDPCDRYDGVTEMQKALEHQTGKRFIDRIPILRAFPGFRSDTLGNMLIAGIIYLSLIPLIAFTLQNYTPISSFLEIYLPYIIVPQVVLFNMGNLQRIFPERLHRNNRLFFKIRLTILLVAFLEPAIINYALTTLNLR